MQRNSSNIFDDMGMSIIDVADIMQMMGLSHTELGNMDKFAKFKEVAHFVKDIPNRERFFNRMPVRPGENKLDFFFDYCNLRKNYEQALRAREENESLLFKSPDDEILREQYENIQGEISDIERTLDVYEN